jgi:putative transposase
VIEPKSGIDFCAGMKRDLIRLRYTEGKQFAPEGSFFHVRRGGKKFSPVRQQSQLTAFTKAELGIRRLFQHVVRWSMAFDAASITSHQKRGADPRADKSGESEEKTTNRMGRFSSTQIMKILGQRDRGVTVSELCRRYGISQTTFYKWREKFAAAVGTNSAEPEQIAMLKDENRRLKNLLGQAMLENSILKEKLASHKN